MRERCGERRKRKRKGEWEGGKEGWKGKNNIGKETDGQKMGSERKE